MPASRWNTNMNDFQAFGKTDDDMLNMLMESVFSRFGKKENRVPTRQRLQHFAREVPEILRNGGSCVTHNIGAAVHRNENNQREAKDRE